MEEILGWAGVAARYTKLSPNERFDCLSRELQFRECPEIDKRACKRDKLTMPPVRGGA